MSSKLQQIVTKSRRQPYYLPTRGDILELEDDGESVEIFSSICRLCGGWEVFECAGGGRFCPCPGPWVCPLSAFSHEGVDARLSCAASTVYPWLALFTECLYWLLIPLWLFNPEWAIVLLGDRGVAKCLEPVVKLSPELYGGDMGGGEVTLANRGLPLYAIKGGIGGRGEGLVREGDFTSQGDRSSL